MKWICILIIFKISLNFFTVDAIIVDKTGILWSTWTTENNKTYPTPDEETSRKEIFMNRLNNVEEHNVKFVDGKVKYKLAIYPHADLSHDEIVKTRMGLRLRQNDSLTPKTSNQKSKSLARDAEPRFNFEFSWKTLGHVSPVKDQGYCGACWAFAATSAIESQLSIVRDERVRLSEQQLVDCDCDNYGCNGGDPFVTLYGYAQKVGLASSWHYPYVEQRQYCKQFRTLKTRHTYDATYSYLGGDEDELKRIIKTHGPAVVGFAATEGFVFYSGGIFSDKYCNSYELNHAMLVVGYGREDEDDYWIVKNAWGEEWGEDGYARIARNSDNMCGIATYGSVPILWTQKEWRDPLDTLFARRRAARV